MSQTQDLLLIIEKKSNRGRKGPMELVWSNLQPRAGSKQKLLGAGHILSWLRIQSLQSGRFQENI